MKLRSEAIADGITLASGNLHIISRGREIANHLRLLASKGHRPQISANKAHCDGFGLIVCKREEGLRRVAIDKLNTENFRGGKLYGHFHRKGGSGGRIFDFFIWLI